MTMYYFIIGYLILGCSDHMFVRYSAKKLYESGYKFPPEIDGMFDKNGELRMPLGFSLFCIATWPIFFIAFVGGFIKGLIWRFSK